MIIKTSQQIIDEKTAQNAIMLWRKSRYYNLNIAYTFPNEMKKLFWYECEQLQKYYKGFGLRIITKNYSSFTCGFFYHNPFIDCYMFCYKTPNKEIHIRRNNFI